MKLHTDFTQAPGDPQLVTAVAYPNFTSNDVTIATALFTFLLPAGTVTLPAIPPAPATGSFTDINGDWDAQLVKCRKFSGESGRSDGIRCLSGGTPEFA
jgi:hypothetical protein